MAIQFSVLNFNTQVAKKLSLLIIWTISISISLSADESKNYEYSFTATQPMAAERHRHVAVLLEDKKVALFNGVFNKTVEVFDPNTSSFSIYDSYNRPFSNFNGISLGEGKVLLIQGGMDFIYNMKLKQLTPTRNSYQEGNTARDPIVIPLQSGKLFVYGGLDRDFKQINKCVLFDPATLTFKEIGKLIKPRIGASVTKISENLILFTGGTLVDSRGRIRTEGIDSVEIFNIGTGKSLANKHSLNFPRSSHTATKLPSGQILIAGGYKMIKDSVYPIKEAEVYDPVKKDFTIVGSMGFNWCSYHHAVKLPSGRVAFLGGFHDKRVVEVFCPKKLKFIVANQLMINARVNGFTSTKFTNGKVLLAGGRVNSSSKVLKEAEVFFEKEVEKTEDNLEDYLNQLFLQLDDRDYSVRKKATDELIALGPEIIPEVNKLLESKNSGVRRIARRILKAFEDRRKLPEWSVEFWGKDEILTKVSFSNYKLLISKQPDSRVQSLISAIKKHEPKYLVVRFPKVVSYREKVILFNLCGWSEFPIIKLGEPLASAK